MAFVFHPAIYKGGQLVELPRPVEALTVQDAWDAARFSVPLADGDLFTGHSRAGVDIAIEGRCGSQTGTVLGTEEAMFTTLESLRDLLDVSSDADKFDLCLYHDANSATYRAFTSCSCVRFESDLSDPHLFGYSLLIHAEDPVLKTTAPGA